MAYGLGSHILDHEVLGVKTKPTVVIFNYKGSIDCSTNPLYPAGTVGDAWLVSDAGKIGGPLGVDVYEGDNIVCIVTGPAGTQLDVGANWEIIEFPWIDNGTDVFLRNDRNLRISNGKLSKLNTAGTVYSTSSGTDYLFKDTYLLANMPLSETGVTGLSTYFTGQAASMVGAINYLGDNLSYLVPSAPLTMTGTDLTISSTIEMPGYLSGGAGQTFVTLTAGQSFSHIIENATFNYITANAVRFNNADLGVIECWINGVLEDSFDLAAVFVEGERSGNQSYPGTPAGTSPGGKITVLSVGAYNSWPPFQKGQARLNLVPADLVQGENSVYIMHTGMTGSTNQTTNTFIVFYDTNVNVRPIAGVPTVAENTLSSAKYLSGVRYYSSADTFNLNCSIAGVFNNTYHGIPMLFTNTMGFANEVIDWDDMRISGPSNPPVTGNSFLYTESAKPITEQYIYTINGVVSVQGRDPFGSGAISASSSVNRLVNTYVNMSTTVIEEFVDEQYRLPSGPVQGTSLPLNAWDIIPSPTGNWVSATRLVNGEAQCYNNGLYYPRNNYTSGYLPSTGQTADYTAFTGNQYYVRCVPAAVPSSSGSIQLVGWALGTLLDISEGGTPTAVVEIKIPGVTPAGIWWNLGKSFGNGNGCRISSNADTFTYSTGTESTAGPNMIIIRITLLNNTVPLLTRYVHMFVAA